MYDPHITKSQRYFLDNDINRLIPFQIRFKVAVVMVRHNELQVKN